MTKNIINLSEGSGGKEMQELIKLFGNFYKAKWQNSFNDSATLSINKHEKLFFTTDSFVVDPIFFPGGDIGKISVCGTINDLAVMGVVPIGLSLSLIIEEGFNKSDLKKIINSINNVSKKTKVPIVTGDTKVMPKGKIDKIVINVSGIGIAKNKDLLDKKIEMGDIIIISGGIGEHATALLSKRFNYKTNIVTDSKPLIDEIQLIKDKIKIAKDLTRGGIASILNEICISNNLGMIIDEEKIPIKNQVKNVTNLLGISPYELACEGRFVCIANKNNAKKVQKILKKFNKSASIIGEITKGKNVILKTIVADCILQMPSGRIVPRIC
jgi:hydrogenase expression/formation protein HypE